MVVDESPNEAADHLVHALADPTRRDILRRCVHGELSVSRLAQAYPISLTAVQSTSRSCSGPACSPSSATDASSGCAPTPTPSAGRGRPSMRSRRPGAPEWTGCPTCSRWTPTVRVRLTGHDGGTRMEVRSVFDSQEQMERLVRMGATEVFVRAVGEMDALLAG